MAELYQYRKDIDGLRALAILPVVLFHLETPRLSGGFVGVDIFFVISGFLITGIIHAEIREHRFSYAGFFERRIRRLLPALTLMMGICGVVAWFLLMPTDFRGYSEALAATTLFLANLYFWKKTDYFGDPVENIPLLHTWSLSVEEQFYILFPPLLILLARYASRHLNWVLCGLFLLSLYAAQRTLGTQPESAFYLVHLRAWEFLAGALLATGLIPASTRQSVRDAASIIGLTLVLLSLVLLDKDSSFPGVTALPAVLGAALIIHAGMGGDALAGRWLSCKPMVFFGLISYSLYLWHWPIYVFFRYYLIEPLTPVQLGIVFLISTGVAWASWRYVEAPFRRRGPRIGIKVFPVAAGVSMLLLLLSLPGIVSKGIPSRLPDEIAAIAGVAKEKMPYRSACFGLPTVDKKSAHEECALGGTGDPEFVLWGDSYALSLAHGADLAASEIGATGRFFGRSLCPPALGVRNYRASKVVCREFNAAVADYIHAHPSVRHVILAGNWPRYLASSEDDGQGGDYTPGLPFREGLEKTLAWLNSQGLRVSIVLPIPNSPFDVPSVLARAHYFDHPIDPRIPLPAHQERMRPVHAYLGALSERQDFNIVDLEPVFCDDTHCRTEVGKRPLYRDGGHLSRLGSETTRSLLAAVLRAPLGRESR